MADWEKIEALLGKIDDVVSTHEATGLPESLADNIGQQTGLPTAVISGEQYSTPDQGAWAAARAASQRVVIPPKIGRAAQEAIDAIDSAEL